MPISWKGTVQQYVGRLHRLHDSKKVVWVYDYVDNYVLMLARMYERRLKGYAAIGYTIEHALIPRGGNPKERASPSVEWPRQHLPESLGSQSPNPPNAFTGFIGVRPRRRSNVYRIGVDC